MTTRLLFVVNDAAFFLSHRAPVALAAKNAGYEVAVATGPGTGAEGVRALGIEHYPLPLSRSGGNPIAEARALWSLYRLFRRVRPDLVHLVTIKPVLYGGLAARLASVPGMVAAISGLGTVFLATGMAASIRRKFVQTVYRLAFQRRRITVIFQNESDRATLVGSGCVALERTVIIPGSGVDLSAFQVVPEPPLPPVITMASRLLRDKGVFEFVAACKIVRQSHPDAVFQLAGETDDGNPTSLTETECRHISEEGVVSLLGRRDDIATLFAESHVVVLPSFREGLPKVLIEAAAAGRPIVTTNVPGCRDAIEPNITGVLVPVKDSLALAEAIASLISDPRRRTSMGNAGRLLAERKFGLKSVIAKHLEVYAELGQDP